MPCLRATSEVGRSSKEFQFSLRLTKSHDFELTDPQYPTGFEYRRIILIRDPLYSLTSYFVLSELSRHRVGLRQRNINIENIWLSHPPNEVQAAYKALDLFYSPPSTDYLETWLSNKREYFIKFFEKWVLPSAKDEKAFEKIVTYPEINKFIGLLVDQLHVNFVDIDWELLSERKSSSLRDFSSRNSPFNANSNQIQHVLEQHKQLFIESAENIKLRLGNSTIWDRCNEG